MPKLNDVVGYLCKKYPIKEELSKSRLTKMVYLADWKSAIKHGKQLTNIRWYFNNYGPYVDDVWHVAVTDDRFNLNHGYNIYGGIKETISLSKRFDPTSLSRKDKKVLDHVIEQTRPLYWNDFIKLVYSTYPVLTGTQGDYLDLEAAAERYKREG